MNKTFKDDFTDHWSLATCTLEDDERVIANEQLDKILQSDLFKQDEKEEDQKKYAIKNSTNHRTIPHWNPCHFKSRV